jgi:hypothetical protein
MLRPSELRPAMGGGRRFWSSVGDGGGGDNNSVSTWTTVVCLFTMGILTILSLEFMIRDVCVVGGKGKVRPQIQGR